MTTNTDQDVTDALRQIAAWYSSERTAMTANVVSSGVDPQPQNVRPGLRPRLALVAVIAFVTVGAIGFALSRSSTNRGPAGPETGPDRATVVDLCLDTDTRYDLDKLRSSGTLHQFGDPDSGQETLVMSSGALHVACGLAQRDNGQWFQVISLADTHLPLASSDDVSVLVAVQLKDRTYIAGQVGSDIETIEVDRVDGVHQGHIDGGWWGASFDALDDQHEPFPPFSIRWTTTAGSSETAQGSNLRTSAPWNLCAQDSTCRDERLVELRELANGSNSTEQAAILADGAVTEDEYRSALRTWGECIAQATNTEVTFDDSGLFTIHASSDRTDAAFERCKESHIAFVTEAVGLAGTTPS